MGNLEHKHVANHQTANSREMQYFLPTLPSDRSRKHRAWIRIPEPDFVVPPLGHHLAQLISELCEERKWGRGVRNMGVKGAVRAQGITADKARLPTAVVCRNKVERNKEAQSAKNTRYT